MPLICGHGIRQMTKEEPGSIAMPASGNVAECGSAAIETDIKAYTSTALDDQDRESAFRLRGHTCLPNRHTGCPISISESSR